MYAQHSFPKALPIGLLHLSGNLRPCEINHKIKTNNVIQRMFSNNFDKKEETIPKLLSSFNSCSQVT